MLRKCQKKAKTSLKDPITKTHNQNYQLQILIPVLITLLQSLANSIVDLLIYEYKGQSKNQSAGTRAQHTLRLVPIAYKISVFFLVSSFCYNLIYPFLFYVCF